MLCFEHLSQLHSIKHIPLLHGCSVTAQSFIFFSKVALHADRHNLTCKVCFTQVVCHCDGPEWCCQSRVETKCGKWNGVPGHCSAVRVCFCFPGKYKVGRLKSLLHGNSWEPPQSVHTSSSCYVYVNAGRASISDFDESS